MQGRMECAVCFVLCKAMCIVLYITWKHPCVGSVLLLHPFPCGKLDKNVIMFVSVQKSNIDQNRKDAKYSSASLYIL